MANPVESRGTQATHDDFVRAWTRWRGQRLLPGSSGIQLAEIKSLLPAILLFEVKNPDEIIIRTAGPDLRQYLGYDLTGANYIALTPPADRPVRYFRLERMLSFPCGAWMRFGLSRTTGDLMWCEAVSLPVGSSSGSARFIMSHVVPLSEAPDPIASPAERVLDLADEFRFFDIGAGVPGTTAP